MAGKKRVVIVGGGIAGLGVVNTLVSKAGDLVDVYVITRDRYYVGGPTRPLLLTNEEEYGRIVRGYENVRNINLIVGSVVSIDPGNRVVNYSETLYGLGSRNINYDYLVITPGVVYDGSSIIGYDKYWWRVANVYDVGRVHVLKDWVWKLNSGTVVVYAPKAPYRCAPAPTETALLMHTVLRHRGVRDRVRIVHVDANDKTQPPVIADVVKSIYDKAGIELITNQEITEIGDGEVVTKSGERYKYDVLALLEPNRAPSFIKEAGLGTDWFEVRSPTDLRSPKFDDVYGAGDAAKLPYPKNQEIAFESALFAANGILSDLGVDEKVNVQYAFVGWAYVGNMDGRLETNSVQFGFDYTQQPPKPMKDPEPKRDYTLQKDRWMQAYLSRLFSY
jgi:sulfide:quinone oxidoreductase